MALPFFSAVTALSAAELSHLLVSPQVRRVIHYALGPEGTNIVQAAYAWSREVGVDHKIEMILCRTPEDSLAKARQVSEVGILPLFWTCAVYFRLNELFFTNPDVFPFLFPYNMRLDDMQLCCRTELAGQSIAPSWRVVSHPSPAPLVKGFGNEVVLTTSNAVAARMCAAGEAELCITTASAAALHKLHTIHSFGSPIMVFFAGTTQHGLNVLLGK